MIRKLGLVTLFALSAAGCHMGPVNAELDEWLPKAKQGDADAQNHVGSAYLFSQSEPNYRKAAYWYTLSANQGNTKAQVSLAFLYCDGHGVEKNTKQCAAWVTKAAEKGDVSAQGILATMYSEGVGIPQDYQLAASWASKAAEQGDVSAQSVLGTLYLEGKGLPQSNKLAYIWFSIAAIEGDRFESQQRDLAAAKLTPAELKEAQKTAADMAHKIAGTRATK